MNDERWTIVLGDSSCYVNKTALSAGTESCFVDIASCNVNKTALSAVTESESCFVDVAIYNVDIVSCNVDKTVFSVAKCMEMHEK